MSLDWKKCIICQESTREALKCSLNSNGSPEDNRQTYLTFFQNVNSIREANALPTELKFGDDVDVTAFVKVLGTSPVTSSLAFQSLRKLKSVQAENEAKTAEQTRREDPHRNAGNASLTLKRSHNVYYVQVEATAISFNVSRCWKLIRASVE